MRIHTSLKHGISGTNVCVKCNKTFETRNILGIKEPFEYKWCLTCLFLDEIILKNLAKWRYETPLSSEINILGKVVFHDTTS